MEHVLGLYPIPRHNGEWQIGQQDQIDPLCDENCWKSEEAKSSERHSRTAIELLNGQHVTHQQQRVAREPEVAAYDPGLRELRKKHWRRPFSTPSPTKTGNVLQDKNLGQHVGQTHPGQMTRKDPRHAHGYQWIQVRTNCVPELHRSHSHQPGAPSMLEARFGGCRKFHAGASPHATALERKRLVGEPLSRLSLSLSLHPSLSVHPSASLSTSIYPSIYPSFRPSVRPPVRPSVCPSVSLSIYLSIHPCIHPSIHASRSLSLSLSLSLCLSVSPSLLQLQPFLPVLSAGLKCKSPLLLPERLLLRSRQRLKYMEQHKQVQGTMHSKRPRGVLLKVQNISIIQHGSFQCKQARLSDGRKRLAQQRRLQNTTPPKDFAVCI